MFSIISSICKKIEKKGFKWFYRRLILEYRTPETYLGKKLKPINIFFYHLISMFSCFVRLFIKKDIISKKTLYFFYDLEVAPITFNFCETLGMANAYRKSLGLDFLYVIFVPGPSDGLREEMDDYEMIIDKNSRHWRRYHLLFPTTHLVPSCSGFSNCAFRFEAEQLYSKIPYNNIYPKDYSTQFPTIPLFYEGARNSSMDIMVIEATAKATQYIKQWLNIRALGRKTIVITLRQYLYMPKRNSNIEAWATFSRMLDPKEYFVVIVPDVEIAMGKPFTLLAEFTHFTEACWNIELRAALYETAYLNLGVNNGPFNLCWLNKKCRYVMFKVITEEVPQTTEEALKKAGFIPGESPAFALRHQKWVWESDITEVLEREFLAMSKYLETYDSNEGLIHGD